MTKYKWDDERGVVRLPDDKQAIQLLMGPYTWKFRKQCGRLLVKALNAQLKAPRRKQRKK